MNNFQACLAEHLAKSLELEVTDVVEALNSFGSPQDPKKTSKSQPKKSSNKGKEKAEIHTCERKPRGKNELCGKRAKNQIELLDGSKHWYCGTEKSGCAKSMRTYLKRERNKKAVEEISKESIDKSKKKGSTTAAERKKNADKKVIEFLKKKGIPKVTLNAKKVETETHGAVHMDWEYRVLFRPIPGQKGGIAYGVLDKDNDTILPLGKKEKTWLDSIGIKFDEEKVKETPKKKFKDKIENSESEDESDEESEDDSDEESDEDVDLNDI